MVINQNGINIEANVNGNVLTYRVISQTAEATRTLKTLGCIMDDQSNFTLKSNKRPSYHKTNKRFYVRGENREHDNEVVTAEFRTTAEATRALSALGRMISQVVVPKNGVTHKTVKPTPGGTTHVRFALIKRSQAQALSLTAKDFYPEERAWDANTKPVVTTSKHFNEHIAQVVDVLNKAYGRRTNTPFAINPHKVTHEQATAAIAAVRSLFDNAERDGYLVALWRTVTGIRGPDHEDGPVVEKDS